MQSRLELLLRISFVEHRILSFLRNSILFLSGTYKLSINNMRCFTRISLCTIDGEIASNARTLYFGALLRTLTEDFSFGLTAELRNRRTPPETALYLTAPNVSVVSVVSPSSSSSSSFLPSVSSLHSS